ncbi:MAG: hypothetical protein ACTHOO_03245 [Alcanivorax sp.]
MLPIRTKNTNTTSKTDFALTVLEKTNNSEREMLIDWLESLLDIRKLQIPNRKKAALAIKETKSRKIIFPIIKKISSMLKSKLWDQRGTASRFAIIGTSIGLSVFYGQSAGIAALGGAIGVPLWVVLGAGGAYAGTIIEEAKKRNHNDIEAEYIIEDSKDDY